MKENKKLRMYLLHLELEKTAERLKFEQTHKLWIYATREENKWGYDIHSVYGKYDGTKPEELAGVIRSMRFMARFNMGSLRGVWLPKTFVDIDTEWFENNKSLLDKHSFTI